MEVAQRRVELFASRATATRVEEIVAKLGIQIPADEVLFFPSLPLRVDTANVVVGEQLLGPVMTVTNSRLAVDAALSLDDTRLVKVGSPVTITEPELGLRINGTVGLIADTPGTLGAEAQRFHIEINPIDAPASLVGASVVLSVTVNSTQGKVLTVPVAALSVSADGASRVQVQSVDKSTKFVTVTPGLTANGLVAVTPLRDSLSEGDLIVVGAGAARPSGSPGDIVNIGSATTVSTSGTETKSSTTKGS